MEKILIESKLTKYTRLKDGTVSFGFQTNREISTPEIALIDQYYGQSGWLGFQANEAPQLPDKDAPIEGSTPSQRLRNTLYAKHIAVGGQPDTFQMYYNKVMEGFIQAVKNSIPDQKE